MAAVGDVRLFHVPAVDEYQPVLYLHRLPRLGDNPLDEVARWVVREAEDYDVAPLRWPEDIVFGVVPGIIEGQEVEEAQVDLEVSRLAYEKVLSVVEAPLHARAVHPEVLHRRPHCQEDEQSEDNRLYDVAREPSHPDPQPRALLGGNRGGVF